MGDSYMGAEKLHEECAVFGVSLLAPEAAGVTYNGLLSLQHRGQEGAGIAVVHEGNMACRKDVGLVSEVLARVEQLPRSTLAVGHTRYSTMGCNKRENVGPFITDYLTGRIATAHNGNVTNAKTLREELRHCGLCFDATSDSEVVSSLIAYWITKEQSTLQGIRKAAGRLQGAFSLVIASGEHQLIALRDPNGYRPLCIGQNETGVCIASESCALDACGFSLARDVRPGELVVVERGKIVHCELALTQKEHNRGLCIFEYVYFARPDSVIDGLSVYNARHNMGAVLAREYPVLADIVCGVPDSGLEAASGYSAASGIPLVSGFVKNRYIGRSFIYPTQSQRDSAVRLKLNPLAANIRGKRVVIVDDSIVRGTTTGKIVRSLKNAGATQVHVRISSPPFRYTCHYGTDIDSERNLIANNASLEEIRRRIGADSLGYISMEGLKQACAQSALPFCTACFTGHAELAYAKKDILE
jgi:amidophosphoribosyltransferase